AGGEPIFLQHLPSRRTPSSHHLVAPSKPYSQRHRTFLPSPSSRTAPPSPSQHHPRGRRHYTTQQSSSIQWHPSATNRTDLATHSSTAAFLAWPPTTQQPPVGLLPVLFLLPIHLTL
ncbi:hypothetical protein HN51_070132, partial [Arachis hypogaea]